MRHWFPVGERSAGYTTVCPLEGVRLYVLLEVKMNCYECKQEGRDRNAIGLCKHCGVALCPEHAHVIEESISSRFEMLRRVALPVHARLVLCATCEAALEQPQAEDIENVA